MRARTHASTQARNTHASPLPSSPQSAENAAARTILESHRRQFIRAPRLCRSRDTCLRRVLFFLVGGGLLGNSSLSPRAGHESATPLIILLMISLVKKIASEASNFRSHTHPPGLLAFWAHYPVCPAGTSQPTPPGLHYLPSLAIHSQPPSFVALKATSTLMFDIPLCRANISEILYIIEVPPPSQPVILILGSMKTHILFSLCTRA